MQIHYLAAIRQLPPYAASPPHLHSPSPGLCTPCWLCVAFTATTALLLLPPHFCRHPLATDTRHGGATSSGRSTHSTAAATAACLLRARMRTHCRSFAARRDAHLPLPPPLFILYVLVYALRCEPAAAAAAVCLLHAGMRARCHLSAVRWDACPLLFSRCTGMCTCCRLFAARRDAPAATAATTAAAVRLLHVGMRPPLPPLFVCYALGCAPTVCSLRARLCTKMRVHCCRRCCLSAAHQDVRLPPSVCCTLGCAPAGAAATVHLLHARMCACHCLFAVQRNVLAVTTTTVCLVRARMCSCRYCRCSSFAAHWDAASTETAAGALLVVPVVACLETAVRLPARRGATAVFLLVAAARSSLDWRWLF